MEAMKLELDRLIRIPTQSELELEKQWIHSEMNAIGLDTLQSLASQAVDARSKSYSPYSHYKVGAAILTNNGRTHSGQNIEIVTYSETGHAEEQSIKNAISSGAVEVEGRKFIRAVAVSHEGDSAP